MEKGHSHGVPPEGPLRINWMWMMAKCTMTEATETRPPQAKSDGEPPKMCVKARTCLNHWWAVSVPPPGNLDEGVNNLPRRGGAIEGPRDTGGWERAGASPSARHIR